MRVLVVEDDKVVADYVKAGLISSGFEVDHFALGQAGKAAALSNEYEAAVFDLALPDIDGADVVKELRDSEIGYPVLFLSAKRNLEDKLKCFEIGGDDFISKPFSVDELVARIKSQIRRSTGLQNRLTLTCRDLTLNLKSRKAKRTNQEVELCPKEFALLELLLSNKGNAVTKKQILEKVFEYNFKPQTNVVDVLVCRLRDKIDSDSNNQIIHTVRRVGYVVR